jgi:hypothetical protein
MFQEGSPIFYDAAADLKKWPSLNSQRLNGKSRPYLVFNGTLAECIRELMSNPSKAFPCTTSSRTLNRLSTGRCYRRLTLLK